MFDLGKMLVIFKLYAEENEQLDEILASVKKLSSGQIEFKDGKREPIAFGLECLKLGFLLPDKVEGILEKLEENLRKIQNVTEVEQAGMTLI